MTGLIFDIKRYAVNDGPGIRTTAFFKGCPLRCRWCHNPESQSPRQETMPVRRKLGDQVFDDHRQVGYLISSDDLVEKLARDFVFFDESGGGVTFSGGEPLMQPEFLVECLEGCRRKNIPTCVDTAGAIRTPLLADIIRLTDIFLFDVKTADADKFRSHIGAGFDIFLDNLAQVAAEARRTIVRIPVIPGLNDDDDSISAIITLLKKHPKLREVSLLPFHRTGADKYKRLGRDWLMGKTPNLRKEDLQQLNDRFTSAGFTLFTT